MRKRLHTQKRMKMRRQELRADTTPAERKLWSLLRKQQLAGRRFRRQYSIGRYVMDFYCSDENLAVELDGAVHDDPLRRGYDAERERFLRENGINVVRFENREVFDDPERVLAAIAWHFENDESRPDRPPVVPLAQGDGLGRVWR